VPTIREQFEHNMGKISELSDIVIAFLKESQKKDPSPTVLGALANQATEQLSVLKSSRANQTIVEMFGFVEKKIRIFADGFENQSRTVVDEESCTISCL
jgi:hypothetical protein